MRATLTALVLALVLLVPTQAQAQYPTFSYGSYYYPPTSGYPYLPSAYGYSYVPPAYGYAPPAYPSYLWSGRYYVNPWSRGWAYQQYNPYTNQYFYRYRVAPRFGW